MDKETRQLNYRGGKGVSDALGGMHGAYEIPTGFPGAGNAMIYDNGVYADHSRAVEVDIDTSKVVWDSTPSGKGARNGGHFSNYISNAERLPNGNTIICSGANARYFEVTPEKQVVWEYINPHFVELADWGGLYNTVFRSTQYQADEIPALS